MPSRPVILERRWEAMNKDYGNILQLATLGGLESTVKILLQYAADPNVQDKSKRTALHIASWKGFPDIVRVLLDYGAKASKDQWGDTPLEQAQEALDDLNLDYPGPAPGNLERVISLLPAGGTRRAMGGCFQWTNTSRYS